MSTYKVKPKKNNPLVWTLEFRTWKDGKLHYQYIPQEKWPAGFSKGMPYSDAKKLEKAYNAEQKILVEQAKKHRIEKRLKEDAAVQSAYLPNDVVSHFERLYLKPLKGKKLADKSSRWRMVRKVISAVGLDPSDWALEPTSFYQYFIDNPLSYDYCKRILAMLNQYGYLFCRKRGTAFSPLPKPFKPWNTQIKEAYEDLNPDGEKSDKLTPDQLTDLKSKLREDNWNWVYISFWFGLRPEEVDLLHKPVADNGWKNWWIENDVLVIWQPKLINVKKKERYKRIPIFLKEQKDALKLIEGGNFKRPGRYALGRFPEGVKLYGGRHGFASHMDLAGHSIDKVSSWLGHRNLSTTERYYQDRKIVRKPLSSKTGDQNYG